MFRKISFGSPKVKAGVEYLTVMVTVSPFSIVVSPVTSLMEKPGVGSYWIGDGGRSGRLPPVGGAAANDVTVMPPAPSPPEAGSGVGVAPPDGAGAGAG